MNLNNYIKTVLSGVKTWALSTFANKRDFDDLNSRMYHSEQVEKFFFKNQQISPMDSYGDYVNMSFLEKQCDEISVGDTLNVVWDGTEYECKVFKYDGALMVGNKSIVGTIMGESFADTGEPFVIAIRDGYEVGFYYTDMVSESHVVSISGMVEKVHQIDKKYLPLKEDDVVLDFLKDFENSNKKHRRDLFTIIWSAIEDGRNIFILHNNDVEIGQKQMYVVYNAVINDDYDPRIDLRLKTGFEEWHMLLYSSGYYELTVNRTLNAISKTSTMNRKVGVDELSGELYSEDIISDKEAKALSNCAVLQESILATDLTDKYYSIAYDDSFDKFIAVPYYHSKELMTSENGLAFDENGEFYIEGYGCQTACGNGIIVALGERNTFYSTDQGATWNKSNENLGSNNYLIYANGFFIAVPSQLSTATCHYSADGKNWTAILRSSSYRATDIAFSQKDNMAIVLTSHNTICLYLRDNSIEESSTPIMLPSPTGVSATWEKILVDNDATDPNKSIYYFDGKTGLCAYGNVALVNAFDFESFVPDADGATTFNYFIQYAGIIDDTIFAISTPTSSKHGDDAESVVFTKKRNGDTWEKTVLFDNKYYIDQVVVGKDRAIALVVDRDDKTQAHTVVTFDGKTWINKIATGNFITPDNSAINFVINGDKGSRSGAKSNQYLVTGNDGQVKWEDKLAWSEGAKLSWDGDISNPNYDAEKNMCKVSDVPMTKEELVGAKITVRSSDRDGNPIYTTGTIEAGDVSENGGAIVIAKNLTSEIGETCKATAASVLTETMGLAPGVYFSHSNGFYSVTVALDVETIHPIDPKLGGMPTLASDGSDAGKFVKVNAAGDGYELVAMTNVAEEGA